MEGESTDSEEEEERAVRPQVAKTPNGSPTKPPGSHPPVAHSVSSLPDLSYPESSSGEEDSNEEEDITYNTGSRTSHTTANSLSSAGMVSAEVSNRTFHNTDSTTESQFSFVMAYTEDTGQTSDSVFVEAPTDPHDSQLKSQTLSQNNISTAFISVDSTPVQTPIPRRSTRSTKGIPPVCYGNVISHCTRVTNMVNTPAYRQDLICLMYTQYYFGIVL